MMDSHTFRPRLEVVECEGHGRWFEVNDGGTYAGTFDTGDDVCRRYAGRIALVYGYDAYDAACAARIAADPTGWDCSDVVPEPVLCLVRPPREPEDETFERVMLERERTREDWS